MVMMELTRAGNRVAMGGMAVGWLTAAPILRAAGGVSGQWVCAGGVSGLAMSRGRSREGRRGDRQGYGDHDGQAGVDEMQEFVHNSCLDRSRHLLITYRA